MGDFPLLVFEDGGLLVLARVLFQEVVVVISGVAIEGCAAEFEDAVAQRVEKGPIVGNDDQPARVAGQIVLEPEQRFQIEMVRRLVEEEERGLVDQEAGQVGAHHPAAGKRFAGLIEVFFPKSEAGEDFLRPRLEGIVDVVVVVVLGLKLLSARRDSDDRLIADGSAFLRKKPKIGAALPGDGAVIGRLLPQDQIKQGGFTGAIGPDEAETVGARHEQRHIAEKGACAVGLRDVCDREHGKGQANAGPGWGSTALSGRRGGRRGRSSLGRGLRKLLFYRLIGGSFEPNARAFCIAEGGWAPSFCPIPDMKNHLSAETSPYLRQHAGNPVDWHLWGEAAFARARSEQKPIFLSIGYSTCHWCHVMAHESFENPAIAELLNRHFISIKVDREDRPDVDRVYMSYVQALTGHGGWPLSAWLTPELKPFYGGTYFPPEDRYGRPGFPSVLNAIARGWKDDRASWMGQAETAIATLRGSTGTPGDGVSPSEPTEMAARLFESGTAAFEKAYQQLAETFDPERGGFGGAPKYPRAGNLAFLFRCAALQGLASEAGREATHLAAHTLRHMARGGIHDQVGGGFHRYSVDEDWFVPHFEKMLYDQAQIALNALEAWQATADERHAWLVRDIVDYVLRDLSHPDGGFYSAEDADSEPAPRAGSLSPGEALLQGRRRTHRRRSINPPRAPSTSGPKPKSPKSLASRRRLFSAPISA